MPQPPPRGCVLKHTKALVLPRRNLAAASARLCVETRQVSNSLDDVKQPPPRGCVLKLG